MKYTKREIAAADRFKLIDVEELKKNRYYRVHVEGWASAAVFDHVHTDANGMHTIKARATGKTYQTYKNLLHIRGEGDK